MLILITTKEYDAVQAMFGEVTFDTYIEWLKRRYGAT